MNKNSIEKIILSIVAIAVVIRSLISNPFNLPGLILSCISIIGLIVLLFVYNPKGNITEKSDIYLLSIVLGVTGAQYGSLDLYYDDHALERVLDGINGVRIILIIGAIAVNVVINIFFRNRLLKRLIGITALTASIAFALSSNLNIYDYFVLGGIVFYFLFTATLGDIGVDMAILGRRYWLTLATILIFLIRRLMFPDYDFSDTSLLVSLNFEVLPYYVVAGLLLIAAIVIGIETTATDDKKITPDMILLGGLASLVVVIKCSVYFHFYYSWLAIILGAMILIAVAIQQESYDSKGIKKKFEKQDWFKNPFFFMLFVMTLLSIIVIQMCYGHIYMVGALIIACLIVCFVPGAFAGWRKDLAQDASFVFSIALIACSLVLTVGFSAQKIILIIGIVLFTFVTLYFVDHNNHIGHNKFKTFRTITIVIFALLMIMPIFKGGSHIAIEPLDENRIFNNYIKSSTQLNVRATADGNTNSIESISYVWSDNYSYDSAQIVEIESDETTLDIVNSHLIIWALDTNGMKVRRDYWFEPYYFKTFEEYLDHEAEVNAMVLTEEAYVMTWNRHSYAIFSNSPTWEAAEEYCESVGGHLAVVSSDDENEVIYAFAQSQGLDNVFIGYSDANREGAWEWANGEAPVYTNWNSGEPNGFTAGEDYALIIYNGCWADNEYAPSVSNGGIFYVCEWDELVRGTDNIEFEEISLPNAWNR